MCRYRYYYFLGCRHQQTVLFDFCDDAQAVPAMREDHGEASASSRHLHSGRYMLAKEGALNREEGDGILPAEPFAFSASSHELPQSLISACSSSVIAEPGSDCASLHSTASSTHSSSQAADTPLHDMAGLQLFGFRQWMAGGSIPATSENPTAVNNNVLGHKNTSTHERQCPQVQSAASSTRQRQPGIRENTDASCDLPKSNDILQHIAEYHRARWNTDAFGQHHQPCSTTALPCDHSKEGAEAQQAYDNIEAEIDVLKHEVWKLRQDADNGQSTPKTEQEQAEDRFLSTRSNKRTSLAHNEAEESAAARLQRLHETQDIEHDQRTPRAHIKLPPKASEFPDLSQTVKPKSNRPAKAEQPRQTSYARAAACGMMEAIGSPFAASCTLSLQTDCSTSTTVGTLSTDSPDRSSNMDRMGANSTDMTQDVFGSTAEDQSVIITSGSGSKEAHSGTAPPAEGNNDLSPINKTAKYVPHFAQPTKAFTRRAGDLRSKDSAASLSPKSLKDGSPNKTLKGKDVALSTAKRASQHQQKRKSLPTGWMLASDSNPDPVDRTAATKIPTPKKTGAKDAKPLSPPRKQTQSYMAPTTAAVQRNMATLGSIKPSVQHFEAVSENHPGDVHISTGLIDFSRPHGTASDTSSVCFILDQPNGLSNSPVHGRNASIVSTPSVSSNGYQDTLNQVPPYSTPLTAPLSSTPAAPRHVATRQSVPERYQVIVGQEPRAPKTYASVAGVANTTTKRRTSHGHLLGPIVSRLATQGLLNKDGPNVMASYSERNNQDPSVFQSLHTGERSSMEHQEVPLKGLGVSYGTAAMGVLPPHLRRSRETSTRSRSTSDTLPHIPAASNANMYHGFAMKPSITEERRDSVMGAAAPTLLPAPTIDHVRQQTRVPSLRPTADVFEPRKPVEDVEATDDIELASRFVPDDEWYQISPARRDRIQCLRALRSNRGWPTIPSHGMLFDGFSPVSDSFLGRFDGTFQPHYDASGFGSQQMYPNKTISAVHAGQILTPSISPGKKSVTWKLKDLNGTETPIRFGRAAPPPFPDPSTPTISSTSDDTGPLINPSPAPGWRIGSTYTAMPYGWKGGDGKEISFMGYGPYAERSVTRPVAFDFKGTNSRHAPDVSHGFVDEEKENYTHNFVVPRSQRQWAEKLRYPKVPCGNFEITHAVESMPGASQLPAYCFDCAGR